MSNLKVMFGGRVFQQIDSRILRITSCAPILADLSLYLYGTYFMQGILKKKKKNKNKKPTKGSLLGPVLYFHVPLHVLRHFML